MMKHHGIVFPSVLLFLLFILVFPFGIAGCGGGGGGGGGNNNTPSHYSINADGGDGGVDGGIGGNAGTVQIAKIGGGEPVEVLDSGSVDAGFSPTAATPALGTNPLSITTDTTIAVAAVEPASGTAYLESGSSALRVSDGNGTLGDETPVTGLSVAAGTTLTLALNSGGSMASITFANDVQNDGTLTTEDVNASQRGTLQLNFANYHGSDNSRIDTSGTLPGQHGGSISMYTTMGSVAIYNRGRIDSAGADDTGGVGGNGGGVSIGGYSFLENSGTINCAGGTSGAGAGGAAGGVSLITGVGHLYNTGAINAQGADGSTSGGPGGFITINAVGELRNAGAINVSGGDGAGGAGGPAGAIFLWANGDDCLNHAALTASGGDTSDAAANGGNGGAISVESRPINSMTPAGNLQMAGDLDVSGGNAVSSGSGNGGSAGTVFMLVDAAGQYSSVNGLPAPGSQRLSLLNYSRISSSGGSANTGGNGYYVVLVNQGLRWDSGSTFVDDPSGDVINEAAITCQGGSVAPGATVLPATGGNGGVVTMNTDTDTTVVDPAAERVINSGSVNTSGGDSLALTAAPSANGGAIQLYSTGAATNSAALTSNGGSDGVDDDSLATGFGHGAGVINLMSILDTTTNSGTLNANGGDGEAAGGNAQGIVLGQYQVVNSAAINARGGNADAALTGSSGGAGGTITMDDDDTPDDTGTLDVSGGAGDTAGPDGTISYP